MLLSRYVKLKRLIHIIYRKSLKFDQSFPNLYNTIAMRDDKNAIPEKIKLFEYY